MILLLAAGSGAQEAHRNQEYSSAPGRQRLQIEVKHGN